jgi:hypothetical protein
MKSLKLYLTESEQTYNFRLKLANEFDDETMNKIETLLDKYELKKISKPKKTPVQEHPMDFQTLSNAEVYIIDAELTYPVTANQIFEYITQNLQVPASHLVVINQNNPEEIAREEGIKEKEYTTKLTDADYKDEEKHDVAKVFGDEYNANMLKELETTKHEFAKEEK